MTQPGETAGFTASDHLRRVVEICGPGLVDVALVNSARPSESSVRRYRRDGAEPVAIDLARFRQLGVKVMTRRIMSEDVLEGGNGGRIVRHHADRVARQILSLKRKT
jgi:2-phospho-L-lactate transferase/gluconeogenesis factor (CofD/UPF0052 family)